MYFIPIYYEDSCEKDMKEKSTIADAFWVIPLRTTHFCKNKSGSVACVFVGNVDNKESIHLGKTFFN